MRYFTSNGRVYGSGLGGTYPVNNGDPQCADEDAPTAEDLAEQGVDEDDWRLDGDR